MAISTGCLQRIWKQYTDWKKKQILFRNFSAKKLTGSNFKSCIKARQISLTRKHRQLSLKFSTACSWTFQWWQLSSLSSTQTRMRLKYNVSIPRTIWSSKLKALAIGFKILIRTLSLRAACSPRKHASLRVKFRQPLLIDCQSSTSSESATRNSPLECLEKVLARL